MEYVYTFNVFWEVGGGIFTRWPLIASRRLESSFGLDGPSRALSTDKRLMVWKKRT